MEYVSRGVQYLWRLRLLDAQCGVDRGRDSRAVRAGAGQRDIAPRAGRVRADRHRPGAGALSPGRDSRIQRFSQSGALDRHGGVWRRHRLAVAVAVLGRAHRWRHHRWYSRQMAARRICWRPRQSISDLCAQTKMAAEEPPFRTILDAQRACLGGGIALGDPVPVHSIPPGLEVIGAAAMVREVKNGIPEDAAPHKQPDGLWWGGLR